MQLILQKQRLQQSVTSLRITLLFLDTEGNMLFSGEDDSSATGTASTQLSLKDKAQKAIKSEVKKVLLGTDLYECGSCQ